MKAKKLIEKLKLLNPEMEVYVPQEDKEFPVYHKVSNVDIDELCDLNTDDSESVVIVIK